MTGSSIKSAMMAKFRIFQSVVLVVFFSMMSTLTHSQMNATAINPVASVSWDSNPETLLVSYRDIWGEFANQDPTPLIRIYGDGRVLVHYPVYTPKAGEYELWLQVTELEDLLLSLLAKGGATFEPSLVRREKQLEELSLQQAVLDAGEMPELFMVADDSTSVFEFHLQSYQAAGALAPMGEINRSISWRGLATDARRYPQLASIQQLRNAELELRELLERNDLWLVR